MGSSRDAYERLVKLYDAGDLEGLVNSYTEDAVLVTPEGTARGRAAIRDDGAAIRSPSPTAR